MKANKQHSTRNNITTEENINSLRLRISNHPSDVGVPAFLVFALASRLLLAYKGVSEMSTQRKLS
jgi:hypothetical protein